MALDRQAEANKTANLLRAQYRDLRLSLVTLIERYLAYPDNQDVIDSQRAGNWVLRQEGLDDFCSYCDGLEHRVFGEILFLRMDMEEHRPAKSREQKGKPQHMIYTRTNPLVIDVNEVCERMELPEYP